MSQRKPLTSAESPSLEGQPEDTARLQAEFLTAEDLVATSLTSKPAMTLFSQSLHESLLKKLLGHIVHGEQKQAEAMIKANPKLLLEVGEIIDYSGCKRIGTPYRLALATQDMAMKQMIESYLDKVDPEEKYKQARQQFPIDQKNENAADIQAIRAIYTALAQADAPDDCKAAFEAYRAYIKQKNEKAISTGVHFNILMLAEALNLLDTHLEVFGGAGSPKHTICVNQIIGYLVRFAPAWLAQAYCQGIERVVAGDALIRSLACRDQGNYYPYDIKSDAQLGFPRATIGLLTAPAGPINMFEDEPEQPPGCSWGQRGNLEALHQRIIADREKLFAKDAIQSEVSPPKKL